MLKNGFIKVACVTPTLEVGNPNYNIKEIVKLANEAKSSITVFPELCISGYTCGDFFYQDSLLDDVYAAIEYFCINNMNKGIVVLGAPLVCEGSLINAAIVIQKHHILGVVPKRTIPNNHEFYEKRWFKSARNISTTNIYINGAYYPLGQILFHEWEHNIHFGIEICEDMWSSITPANNLALCGANMTINLSASNEVLGKAEIRRNTVLENSRRNCGAYIYASAGVNESTSDTVYSGHNIVACCGSLVKETENFSMDSEIICADIDIKMIEFARRNQTDMHDDLAIDFKYQEVDFTLLESENYQFENSIDNTPFVPKTNELDAFNKIASLQEYALYKRLKHTGVKTLVIGVSGGLDSTLALLVTVRAFDLLHRDRKDIIAITMPCFGTTNRTKSNAEKLANALAESFMAAYPGVTVTAEFTGSGAGIEAVTAGSVDIGNASRNLTDDEKAAGIMENIVAIDGIAVVADTANEVAGLTADQLASIYKGEITNWSEVGGADQPIVVVGREAGSGTRSAFEELLAIEDQCAYANELDSTGAVMAKVASTPGAIGYVSLDVLDDTVKTLAIDEVEPTVENIKGGSYALSRPFVMATNGEISEQSEAVQAIFTYLASDEGKALVESVGLITVD